VLAAAPAGSTLSHLGAPSLMLGSAALVVFAAIGYAAVAAPLRVFVAGLGAGLAGLLCALLCLAGMSSAGAVGVTLTVAIAMLPGYPLVATWLGKLPVPALPDRPEDILEDRPMPRREGVVAAVARAGELLSGMLLAAAVVSVCCAAVLAVGYTVTGRALAGTAAAALLLRGRLFPAPHQRVPLMSAGIAILVLLLLTATVHTGAPHARLLLLLIVVVVAGLVLAAGLVYSRRAPSPYIGRMADIVDVLAIMALVPLACAVAGVFHTIQGLFASVGG
jgi:type VII secretion integral membrane protein EccD